MLPTKKVLFWSYNINDEMHLWDPETNQITQAAYPELRLFCSGHSFLPDGTLLVTGGQLTSIFVGLDTAVIYDPYNDIWIDGPNMNDTISPAGAD